MTRACNASKIVCGISHIISANFEPVFDPLPCLGPGTMNMIKMIWTPWYCSNSVNWRKVSFFFQSWRHERQGALETDLLNCYVSITWQSLSMHTRSAREHCDSADATHIFRLNFMKFYFSVRISYKFLFSECKENLHLGLCSSWNLANRTLQRSGRICFQQANLHCRNSEPIRALHSIIMLARCQELHRRQACILLQIDIRNLYDFHHGKIISDCPAFTVLTPQSAFNSWWPQLKPSKEIDLFEIQQTPSVRKITIPFAFSSVHSHLFVGSPGSTGLLNLPSKWIKWMAHPAPCVHH